MLDFKEIASDYKNFNQHNFITYLNRVINKKENTIIKSLFYRSCLQICESYVIIIS